METTIYAILGYLAKAYNNQISIDIVNSYLRDYEMKPLTRKELKHYINEVSQEDSEANKIYNEVKLKPSKLNAILGYVDEEPQTYSLDINGHKVKLPASEVHQITSIVNELQQASPSHNIPWGRIKKICTEQDLYFSDTRAFKNVILRHLDSVKQQPTLEKTPSEVNFATSALVKEFGILNARKRSIQNDQKIINKAKRDLLDQSLLRQEVLQALADPIELPRIIKQDKEEVKPTDNDLIVVLSDLHIGALVRHQKQIIYDYQIAQTRLNEYMLEVMKQIDYFKPKQVHIVMLGDLIENIQMRKNQGYETELTLGEQIRKGSELVINFVRGLLIQYPKLKFDYVEIEGNHDRFSPSKDDEIPQDGASLVASTIISATLNNYENFKVITPKDQYRYLVSYYGKNILFVHGDRDKLKNDNTLGKLANFLDTPLDVLVGGHLHSIQAREVGYNKFILQTGSLIGSSSYSNSLGVKSTASQMTLLVNQDTIKPIFVTNLN